METYKYLRMPVFKQQAGMPGLGLGEGSRQHSQPASQHTLKAPTHLPVATQAASLTCMQYRGQLREQLMS
eukprot:scaffold12764_cov17-Prasinocladus_malaysianus.AAC.1